MRIVTVLGLAWLLGCGGGGSAADRSGTTGGETATEAVEGAGGGGLAAEPMSSPDAEPSGTTCANVRCAAGTHCEMVQVQCVRAPCPPLPQCVAD